MLCSIVIPCYNGGSLLKNNLPKLFTYLLQYPNHQFEVVVINDGSKDNTFTILKSIKGIKLLSYGQNKGKGGAVQYGINHVDQNSDVVIVMDADCATDFKAINETIDMLTDYDVVAASRFIKGSYLPIKRSLKRRIVSKICSMVVNLLFRFHIKDTQCGFKGYKCSIAKMLASKQTIQDWAFDVEYLCIAKIHHYKIKELPVTWTESDQSTVKVTRASSKFIRSLLTIKRNAWRKKY